MSTPAWTDAAPAPGHRYPPLLDLAESMAQADFRASLSRLDAPLLVVLGARSPHYAGVPLDAWYRDTVKHAQVSVSPGRPFAACQRAAALRARTRALPWPTTREQSESGSYAAAPLCRPV